MLKNLIRGLIVLSTIVAVFFLIEKVFMLKSEDGIEQMRSFYLQEDNTVDVLLVGSSHIYCNINTGKLWDEYGISAYNLGGAEQPYWNSYYFIKEALKTQKPKVIVLSITIPGIRFDEYQTEAWLTTNIYGMNWNKNRIDNTRVSAVPESFWRILIPMNTIHGRYTDISKEDFVDRNYDISYKGYDLRETIVPLETPDISNVTERVPIIPKQEEYLRKIIALSKEENIPLLMVSVPFAVTEEAQKIYNYEFDIAAQEGVDYIDFNKCYDEIGLDFKSDMAEELHLNIYGGEKFTKYLGQCLLDRYDITDHRGDALYSSWDTNALIHRQELLEEEIRSTDEITDYLSLIDNENYLVMMDIENVSYEDINSKIIDRINALGIETNDLSSGYAVLVNNNNKLFESSESDFKFYYDAGIDKLNLIRQQAEDGTYTTHFYVDTTDYPVVPAGISVFVYDKLLNEITSLIVYNPLDGKITRYY